MHIGYYAPCWPPEGAANGIVTYVNQMRTELLRLGHKVSVVAPGVLHLWDGKSIAVQWQPSLIERLGTRISGSFGRHHTKLPSAAANIVRAFSAIDAELPLDLIEIEESFGWCGTVQDRLKIPVVTRLHGPHFLGQCDLETGRQAELSALRAAAEGVAISRARFVTAPSATLMAATFAEYGSSARSARFIPNPITAAGAQRSWSMTHCDPDLVLCVGRFDRRKGADVAISAFLEVLRYQPNARLAMAGPQTGLQLGEDWLNFDQYCQRFVPEDLRNKITHLGLLKPDELAKVRLEAFVTIVCSRFENFPYAIAEAMSLGCPTIATRSFGNAEMIEDGATGMLVDVEAPDQLAAAIVRAFTDPKMAEALGAAGQRRCTERYSLTGIALETLEFYREALA